MATGCSGSSAAGSAEFYRVAAGALFEVLYLLIASLPPESRRRFVHHLLLAFHPDRCPLAEAHAVAVVLTQLMDDFD